MGGDKDKDKKDKDKKDKDKDKKDKDYKDKDKKDKDYKDKDKKDKDKDKDKKEKPSDLDEEWKVEISVTLDNLVHAYEKITNMFKDIDNYILPKAMSRDDFVAKVSANIADLPDASKQIFLTFLNAL